MPCVTKFFVTIQLCKPTVQATVSDMQNVQPVIAAEHALHVFQLD